MRKVITAAALVSVAFSVECDTEQMGEVVAALLMCGVMTDPAERCTCFSAIRRCDGLEAGFDAEMANCSEDTFSTPAPVVEEGETAAEDAAEAEDAATEDAAGWDTDATPAECYGEEIQEFVIKLAEVGSCYIEALFDPSKCDAAKACADEISDPGCTWEGESLATTKAASQASCNQDEGSTTGFDDFDEAGIPPLCSFEFVNLDIECDTYYVEVVNDEFCSCIERDGPFSECIFAGEDMAAKYNAFREVCISTTSDANAVAEDPASDTEAAGDPCFYSDADCWNEGDDYSYYDTQYQYFNDDPSSAAAVTILETMVALAALVSFL